MTDRYDIIGELQTYCTSKGWLFAYGVDSYYRSAETLQSYNVGQRILIVDFRFTPRISNIVQGVRYTCLFMLGAKFDSTGLAASLDETSLQKYDRRIKDLLQELTEGIAEFSCNANLEVDPGEAVVEINQLAENIDFVVYNNCVFDYVG
jgi:propanediol dehydratase large subunit